MANLVVAESAFFRRETETASMGLPLASSTLPLILPDVSWPKAAGTNICRMRRVVRILIAHSVCSAHFGASMGPPVMGANLKLICRNKKLKLDRRTIGWVAGI